MNSDELMAVTELDQVWTMCELQGIRLRNWKNLLVLILSVFGRIREIGGVGKAQLFLRASLHPLGEERWRTVDGACWENIGNWVNMGETERLGGSNPIELCDS